MKKAFTLAEVLITLTVIGIITAVIVPVAIHSKPDENTMKFKKAHNTLYQVISTLVNSDKYYLNGDLGIKPDGSLIDEKTAENIKYFCNSFADIITAKKVNCSATRNERKSAFVHITTSNGAISDTSDPTLRGKSPKELLDFFCKEKTNVGAEIIANDNIVFYQTNPAITFGINNKDSIINDEGYFTGYVVDVRLFGTTRILDGEDFDTMYKIFCIDIDGINNAEDPFGYGIRADGKILTGKRADEWLEKSIQGEK